MAAVWLAKAGGWGLHPGLPQGAGPKDFPVLSHLP